ncbi:hypothetical protein UL79_10820, partial [Shigella dysenteriae]
MDRFPRSDSIVQPRAGLQTYMAQVYGWMTVGLLLTAFVAWYAANSAAVMELLFGFAPIFPDICYHLTHYKP